VAGLLAPLVLAITTPLGFFIFAILTPAVPHIVQHTPLVNYAYAGILIGIVAVIYGYIGVLIFGYPFYFLLFLIRRRKILAMGAAAGLGYFASFFTVMLLGSKGIRAGSSFGEYLLRALLNPLNLLSPISLGGAAVGVVFWFIASSRVAFRLADIDERRQPPQLRPGS
jgi:hypothetical protein